MQIADAGGRLCSSCGLPLRLTERSRLVRSACRFRAGATVVPEGRLVRHPRCPRCGERLAYRVDGTSARHLHAHDPQFLLTLVHDHTENRAPEEGESMDPQLSSRVGSLMTTDAVRALLMESVDRHLAFVDEVSRAESFDTLPAWVQEVILEGEREFVAYRKRDPTRPAGEP